MKQTRFRPPKIALLCECFLKKAMLGSYPQPASSRINIHSFLASWRSCRTSPCSSFHRFFFLFTFAPSLLATRAEPSTWFTWHESKCRDLLLIFFPLMFSLFFCHISHFQSHPHPGFPGQSFKIGGSTALMSVCRA